MWLCILSGRSFEETFENAQWRKPNKCNQCDFTSSEAGNLRKHLKTQWRQVKQTKNPLRQAILGSIGKVVKIYSVWLCSLSSKPSDDTHEKAKCKWFYDKCRCNLKPTIESIRRKLNENCQNQVITTIAIIKSSSSSNHLHRRGNLGVSFL